jgi:hypothetical protein
MLNTLRKFWHSLRRYPVALLLAGLIAGVPIGWFLGLKPAVEQVSIPAAKATAYTALSDEELKNKSAQLASAIRGLTQSYYQEDDRLRMTADENSGKTTSQAERDRIRKTWIDESAKLHDMFLDRYKTRHWADAILLRQAIVAKVGGAPGAHNPILFEHPTNILGIEQVANSLELLGKSLPTKEQPKP